jgi:hypothetical protein
MNASPLNSEAASTKISPGAAAQDNHQSLDGIFCDLRWCNMCHVKICGPIDYMVQMVCLALVVGRG